MGRLKQKGKAGAAKAYITRSAAVKKLQCSLADFRRLCILKGIFPREPKSRKKANKGSSAPTSFYYTKDIAYLAHEPVLRTLRDHKAFAKKLSRALGRGEWSSAKSLEEHKPVYTLDHIIKERYPTFIDALRDIDDPLCLIFLFANLPSNPRIPPSLIENCTRLADEWQLYVMKSQSLRKVFLSIKGIYYQAEVLGQSITWLVPYMFTQTIPTDVDARVMLTFLELYQTLLGFVFFKLYVDLGLVYPPPKDVNKEKAAVGFGSYSLQEMKSMDRQFPTNDAQKGIVDGTGKKVFPRDVQKTIKAIQKNGNEIMDVGTSTPLVEVQPTVQDDDDDFVPQPSQIDGTTASLPTLRTLSQQAPTVDTDLFAPYTFFLSRETPRPLMEFVIRSFGGRVGWTPSQGGGSPIQEDNESITHVIIDRPTQAPAQESISQADAIPQEETEAARRLRLKRKYIQPQWVVDCINKGKILLEGPYEQGKILPPHLSPFGEEEGAYEPEEGENLEEGEAIEESAEEDETDHVNIPIADLQGEEEALRVAELQAEAAGVDYNTFEKAVKKQTKHKTAQMAPAEEEMRKMMLSRKKRKLYEKMKYTEQKKAKEREALTKRRDALKKEKKSSVKYA